MSSQNQEPRSGEERAPELELNKETLQDLDVEPGDANDVKGGGSIVAVPSVGLVYTQSRIGGVSTSVEASYRGSVVYPSG